MIHNKKDWLFDLLWLTLLLSSLYAVFLGSRPLAVPDEARYVEIPREMIELNDFITPHLNYIKYLEKPPLFYWLQAGAIKTLGYNFWVFRFITALLGILGCLMIYLAGCVLYSRVTGLLSSLILASSLLYFGMGHYITLDMTVSTFITGTLLSFIVAIQYPSGIIRRNLLLAMYVSAALALLTKGLIGIALPGLVIFAWFFITNEWRQLANFYWLTGIILFLIIALPWHIIMQHRNPEFFYYYIIEQHILRYSTLISKHYQPLWWFLPIVLVGFLPWTGFFLQALYANATKSRRTLASNKVTLFIILWFILILGFYSFSNSKLIPYILPIWPAMALLTGHFISNSLKQPISLGIRLNFLFLIIFLPLLGVGIIIAASCFSAKLPSGLDVNTFYYYGLTIIVCAAGIGWLYYRNNFKLLLLSLTLIFSLLFSSAMLLLPYIDTRSTLSLAKIMQPLLDKNTEIFGYYQYYQDIPVYLRQRLTVVNAREELADGMRYQDASDWMINSAELQKRWQHHNRMFLIANKKQFSLLETEGLKPFYVIGQTKRNILISNKPIATQELAKD